MKILEVGEVRVRGQMYLTDTGKTKLFPGDEAFHLVDSEGFPYEIFMDILRERDAALDTVAFMRCALKSKNFTVERLKNMMLGGSTITEKMFDAAILYIENGGKGILE